MEKPNIAAKDIIIDKASIHYKEAGRGNEILVFLHGITSSSEEWIASLPKMTKSFRAIAVDFPGHGNSDTPEMDYSVKTLSHFLIRFLNALEIKKATLIGHSLGGAVALQVAIQRPKMVDKLVLLAPGYAYPLPKTASEKDLGFTKGSYWLLFPITVREASEYAEILFANANLKTDQEIARLLLSLSRETEYATKKLMESFLQTDGSIVNEIKEIQHKTLLIWGEHDNLTPMSLGFKMRNDIKNSELVIFEKSGHSPNFEEPKRFIEETLSFIKRGF